MEGKMVLALANTDHIHYVVHFIVQQDIVYLPAAAIF
jgi:hypothetical protein